MFLIKMIPEHQTLSDIKSNNRAHTSNIMNILIRYESIRTKHNPNIKEALPNDRKKNVYI